MARSNTVWNPADWMGLEPSRTGMCRAKNPSRSLVSSAALPPQEEIISLPLSKKSDANRTCSGVRYSWLRDSASR
jgi:hypothetical protein